MVVGVVAFLLIYTPENEAIVAAGAAVAQAAEVNEWAAFRGGLKRTGNIDSSSKMDCEMGNNHSILCSFNSFGWKLVF